MRNATRWLIGAGVVSVIFMIAFAGAAQDLDKDVPAKATAGGNYSKLLRKIAVPQDQTTYGDFFESGYFPAIPGYAGFQDLPAGHWVYVFPNWFIWKESKKPRDSSSALAELLTRNDPFSVMSNKDVSIRIMGNETIKGRISENRAGFLLLHSQDTKKSYWINKTHVSYVQFDDEGKSK